MPFDGSNHETAVTNPVTDLLGRAWRLIDKPQKWCRGQRESANGQRHCSLDALFIAGLFDSPADQRRARVTLCVAMTMPSDNATALTAIHLFNDSSSHREVAAAWQRAIALSRTLP